MKLGGMVSFGSDTSEQSAKVFSNENLIFHQFAEVFSLESFLLYGIQSNTVSHTHFSNVIPVANEVLHLPRVTSDNPEKLQDAT